MIRLMIADDHNMVREGIKQLLELDENYRVLLEAGDGVECMKILNDGNRPDILLLDINMPNMNGLEVLSELGKIDNPPKVIILTVHDEIEYLLKAVDIGIDGYILKDSNLMVLKKAINAVFSGESYIQPELIPELNKRLIKKNDEKDLLAELTKREIDVLKLVAEGKFNKEIAEKLGISERTVKNHVSNMFKKIGVADRTQAAVFAIRNNLVDIF